MQEPKPNDKRAEYLIKIFYAMAVASIIVAIFYCYTISFYTNISNGSYYSDDHVTVVELGEFFLGLLYTGLNIAVIVLFIYWFRRAYANLNRLNIEPTVSKDNMTIWGFAIPIMNFFKPYQMMKEVWFKSQYSTLKFNPNYIVNNASGFILTWWIWFVIADVIGKFIYRMPVETAEENANIAIASTFSSLFDIVGVFLTVTMIKKIGKIESDMFNAYHNRPTTEEIFPPPILPPYQPK